jgi:hypothetical protein
MPPEDVIVPFNFGALEFAGRGGRWKAVAPWKAGPVRRVVVFRPQAGNPRFLVNGGH